MADIVPGLLICLMAVQTSQHEGNTTKSKTNSQPGVIPKTFKGLTHKPNHTNQLPALLYPNTDPPLYVNPEDPVTAYTTGVLSTWVIPSSYIVAMLVGIPSNAYILAFLRLRLRAKSLATVILYLNLALTDLLLLLSLALRVHYHLNGNHWIFGEISCRLITALFYGNVYCSAQTIACISLKRYLAVVKPFLYRRLAKTTLALWACLLVWFLFGVAIIPELLVRQSYQITQLGITTCHDVLPLEEKSHSPLVPYRLMLVGLGFIVPLLICVYAHTAVAYHLGQSACDWRPFIKVSTLVFIIFVVCFLPSGILHIAHYIRLFTSGDDRLYGYYRVAVCLCCFHSCLDPFLCILISKTATSELQFISLRGIPQRPAVTT
ncbi:proteinase-activated receptor 3 [Acanthochromis polyacanthus]|uniref:Coagulation factor II (thrombin) receptor-like 2 n=1 Tax=Acanthochromis polyacanthus TaxID=80966 RepID=A0A3Q1H4P7_9TELE|nr:proteinase-activated receptor 3 [Acanthochromis polyacanthus]